jgi:Amt family ammonium transporter
LNKKEPLASKVAAAVGKNRAGINMMWTLITGFLVMFMQTGFAMVETGLTQAWWQDGGLRVRHRTD